MCLSPVQRCLIHVWRRCLGNNVGSPGTMKLLTYKKYKLPCCQENSRPVSAPIESSGGDGISLPAEIDEPERGDHQQEERSHVPPVQWLWPVRHDENAIFTCGAQPDDPSTSSWKGNSLLRKKVDTSGTGKNPIAIELSVADRTSTPRTPRVKSTDRRPIITEFEHALRVVKYFRNLLLLSIT